MWPVFAETKLELPAKVLELPPMIPTTSKLTQSPRPQMTCPSWSPASPPVLHPLDLFLPRKVTPFHPKMGKAKNNHTIITEAREATGAGSIQSLQKYKVLSFSVSTPTGLGSPPPCPAVYACLGATCLSILGYWCVSVYRGS